MRPRWPRERKGKKWLVRRIAEGGLLWPHRWSPDNFPPVPARRSAPGGSGGQWPVVHSGRSQSIDVPQHERDAMIAAGILSSRRFRLWLCLALALVLLPGCAGWRPWKNKE